MSLEAMTKASKLKQNLWEPFYVQNLTSSTIFEKKTIWMGPKVIWGLSDTLSDLDRLNQGEYSKYQLCSGEPRSPDPGLATGMMDTLSNLDKLNHGEYSKYHLYS